MKAITDWLNHTFLQGAEIKAEDIFMSNGVTSLLNTIFLPLADAGEGVLIPAPYYPAFDMDLMVCCYCLGDDHHSPKGTVAVNIL